MTTESPGLPLKLITPVTARVIAVPTDATMNMFRKPNMVVTRTVPPGVTDWADIYAVTVPGVLA